MKLDPDCIRDILIEIEKISTTTTMFNRNYFVQIENLASRYSSEEIAYHVYQLGYDGLLVDFKAIAQGDFQFSDLSPEGHRFLANIGNNNNWKQTKNIAHKLGGISLAILKNVSQEVIKTFIVKEITKM